MGSTTSFWHRYRYWLLALFVLVVALLLLFGFASPAAGVKQFTLNDGGVRISKETKVHTVGEALRELGIELAYADEVIPEATVVLQSGMEVRLRRSTPVLVKGPSGEGKVYTRAKHVAEFLGEIGYELSDEWQVRPDPQQEIVRDLAIELVRVLEEDEEIMRTLTYQRKYKSNRELPYGQEVVIQEGKNGQRLDQYRIRYENGQEVSRRRIAAEVVLPRQDLIIEQGVKVVAGQSLGKVKASYYADFFHGRTTANGETFYNDRLTAAHRKLSFGTVVKVTNPVNGKSIIVPINDRGPYVAGREIDLSRAAFEAISPLSRGVIPVELEVISQGEVAAR